MTRSILSNGAFLVAALGAAGPLAAQADARVTMLVTHDTLPVTGATVRSGGRPTFTDAGIARLMLPAGSRDIVVAMIGFAPETLRVTLTPGTDTTLTVALREMPVTLSDIVVTSTRTERRGADEPTRIETIGPEEIAEQTAMLPATWRRCSTRPAACACRRPRPRSAVRR